MKLAGKVVAITGAGGGIGRATALQFAKQGSRLALSDINLDNVEETAALARELGVQASTARLDVADRAAFYAWSEAVHTAYGEVHVIVNNAGVALGATVEGSKIEDIEWLMNINFWGVVYGTKAFLPLIKASGGGTVVNISSLFGIIGVPTQSAYNAAKFAVRGFTEALQLELAVEGSNVRALCVHPGGIKTDIARNSRLGDVRGYAESREEVAQGFDKLARTSADEAGRVIVKAVENEQQRLLIGIDAKAIELAQRLLPNQYKNIFARIERRRNLKKN